MNVKITFLALFLLIINTFSQEISVIKAGENQILIKKLNVKVFITGDIALTTFDMQFYNPQNRVLEGELSFPLRENQSVTRFALDLGGYLREAVLVEKEQARVAFESTVRNRIDPALLEQTKGNNYKARVYPIPAKGYKRVVVAFQQKLLVNNDSYYYKLPLNFKHKLDDFSISFEVLNQKNKPISKKGLLRKFEYDAENNRYFSVVKKRKTTISQSVFIQIPLNVKKQKWLTSGNYLYFNKILNLKQPKTSLENEITIFWDASLSQEHKKKSTEIDLLDAYFQKVKNCSVNLVIFNTEIRKEQHFLIKNGEWKLLKNTLKNCVYDGASSFDFLKSYEKNTLLNFLFSDGLNTLNNTKIRFKNKTHVINSVSSANHLILKNAADLSGGKYINLQQISIKTAFENLSKNQIQFLGINFSEAVLEIYPKAGSVVSTNFSMIGKGGIQNKTLKLFFGNDKDTLKVVSIFVNKNSQKNRMLSKIWAQKKMDYLAVHPKENREKIIKISKRYQIISPFTSMLILDRVEDYVTHNIEPPKELKKHFDELVAVRLNDKKERISRLQNRLFSSYNSFLSWYDVNHQHVKIEERVLPNPNNSTPPAPSEDVEVPLENGEFYVSGTVSDSSGSLPGVSVFIKGTNSSTSTDFDGKYYIKARRGNVIEYGYLGYKGAQKTIGNSRVFNAILNEDANSLDEVVVVSYGIKRKSYLTGTITAITTESISNTLSGYVSGVQITNNLGAQVLRRM